VVSALCGAVAILMSLLSPTWGYILAGGTVSIAIVWAWSLGCLRAAGARSSADEHSSEETGHKSVLSPGKDAELTERAGGGAPASKKETHRSALKGGRVHSLSRLIHSTDDSVSNLRDSCRDVTSRPEGGSPDTFYGLSAPSAPGMGSAARIQRVSGSKRGLLLRKGRQRTGVSVSQRTGGFWGNAATNGG
jgi:hypothetical protein